MTRRCAPLLFPFALWLGTGLAGCSETADACPETLQAECGPQPVAGGDAGIVDVSRQVRTGSLADGRPPEREPDTTDATSAGEGPTRVNTQQEGDPGDDSWMLTEDANGDGEDDDVTIVFDDETGDLIATYVSREGNCEATVTVIFDGDGVGGRGDGSGRFLVASTCEADDVVGCEFDSEGNNTACGVCAADEANAVWACVASGSAPDPLLCECDVDDTCSDGCNCDLECIAMCSCDVDFACSDGCDCDFECVFGTCDCDVDLTCTDGCACDYECLYACECDVDLTCTAGCDCDPECGFSG